MSTALMIIRVYKLLFGVYGCNLGPGIIEVQSQLKFWRAQYLETASLINKIMFSSP